MATKRSYRKIHNKQYLQRRRNQGIARAIWGKGLKKKSSRTKKKTKLTNYDKTRLRYKHAIWNIQDRLGLNRNSTGT